MQHMDNHLKELNNEIYQKVGRNLVLFQRIEGLLKYLLLVVQKSLETRIMS